MSRPAIAQEKARLRRVLRDRLRGIDPARALEWSNAATRRLLALPEVRNAPALLLFRSLRGEIDTTALFVAAFETGKAVYAPRVEGETLSFVRVDASTRWGRGPTAALEPSTGEAFDAAAFAGAVVVVPGLGFASDGSRLGRGGGHYDRALTALGRRVLVVGLAFEEQVLDSLPVAGHDRPVGLVVTEQRTLRPET